MKKILIVDDISLNRDVLADAFSDSYEIIEASSGMDALYIVETQDISAILLDLIMPKMSGIEVLRTLSQKQMMTNIPVFVVTAEQDEDTLRTAYDLGAVDVITKPFNPDFIRKRIENVIELYELRRKENSVDNT